MSATTATKTDTQTYIRYLRELPRYKMVCELEESTKPQIQEVARAMGIDCKDSDGKQRSKGVLFALIYSEIVKGESR